MKNTIVINQEYLDKDKSFLLDTAPLNFLYGKEVYFSSGLMKNKFILFQLIGNLGAYANDYELDNSINVFVIGDCMFLKLINGIKEDIINQLEKKLNSKGQAFKELIIVSESTLIDFIIKRTVFYKDKSTQDLLDAITDKTDISFVAIDFETANNSHSSACEIGMVKVINGQIKDKFHSLIKPPNNDFARGNTLVHGIKPEMTENSLTFDIIWPEIKKFIGDNLIVAHNMDFDLRVLKQTAANYSIEIPNYKTNCTYQIYGVSLSKVSQAFGINPPNHNALIDAEACAISYINYINKIEPDYSKVNPTEKRNLFDFTGHEKIESDYLKPNFDEGDVNCLFYKKKVVITGVFENISRQEIARILQIKGADVDTSITSRTNYVISGSDPGPSKIRLFDILKNAGHDIKLISETDFLQILKDYPSGN